MKKWKHFGTDGIRGIIGDNFDSDFITKVAKATIYVCRPQKIIIGCDTRRSCDFITSVFSGVFTSYGIEVINVGIVPTAALSYLTHKLKSDLGIMVSASHNNFTYNGIKFFSSSGEKLDDETTSQIDKLISKKVLLNPADADKVGKIVTDCRAIKLWQNFLIKKFKPVFKPEKQYKVAVDCAYGSGAECAYKVLTALGFDVTLFNTEHNGTNINSGCGATQPAYMSEQIANYKLQCTKYCEAAPFDSLERSDINNVTLMLKPEGFIIGFAFDGDADRCIVFDEQGTALHGDILLSLLANYLKDKDELFDNKIAVTILFNLGVEKKLKENGISLIRTPVGDRYIYKVLKNKKLSFGGETSGHIIFPSIWRSGDGLLTALMLLSMLSQNGQSLSQLTEGIEIYPQVTNNVEASNVQKANLFKNKEFEQYLNNSEKKYKDYKMIIRPSGTENFIRVTVEGAELQKCKQLESEISFELKKYL